MREENYRDWNITPVACMLPFEDGEFDGILASHFFEHFDVQEAIKILAECRRVLTDSGLIVISVPNTDYFVHVLPDDKNENWPELFDVNDPKNPIPTFFEAALFFEQHKMLFTAGSLWALIKRAGFNPNGFLMDNPVVREIYPHLNRRKFSLEMVGYK